LQTVGARLTGAVAHAGLVARLGGDEFTVLLEPLASPKEAVDLASSIHRALLEPLRLENGIVKVGASIGIAFAETGLSDSEILRRADAAMYAAKQSTDSLRVALYHPGLDEAERRRGRLAAEFKKALDQDELALHFQPLVSARTGRIEGVEALLRWTHRELGPVNTADILDLAEVSNRVDDLNAWIFQTALHAVAGCNIRPDASFFVAVNVSPVELDSDALVSNVHDALLLTGVPVSRVIIELSERIVATRGDAIPNVQRLIDIGVMLALDDFGEGRTSLAHLRGLPISQLKLDRLLVQQACTAEADRIILESVVALAHDLRFTVVAEGVEDDRHRAAVTAAGADLLQGYAIDRPMPIERLRPLLVRDGLTTTVLPAVNPAPVHQEAIS
ncbi:MAG: bifunctional diguanylate cyclase/phosphodiesterase, partial [Acidimicrobiales bacterium]